MESLEQQVREQYLSLQAAYDSRKRELAIEEFVSGDVAWMIISSVLVLLMTTPGLMLYYSGMVRLQNVLSTAMQSFSIACLITLLWLCFGYSLAFGPANVKDKDTSLFGDASRFWLVGLTLGSSHQLAPTIPESVFCAFQLSFAIITPSLICGAFADRMKYGSMLLFAGLWHLLVYCPIAHSHWHPSGFLYKAGVLDFAGGDVVHIASGCAAAVSAIVIGQRTGLGKTKFHPHNLLITITGACLLCIGWFGFNGGAAYTAGQQSGMIMLNTQLAASAGSITWMSIDYLSIERPTVMGIVNGAIAGLIGITPACGYVDTTSAVIIGALSGFGCYWGVRIKDVFDFDDALDAFGMHAIAGSVGMILLGLLAKDAGRLGKSSGAFYGNPEQLGLQIYGVVFTAGWSLLLTYLILKAIDAIFGLRVSAQKENIGLDLSEHGTSMNSQLANVPKRRATRMHSNNGAVNAPDGLINGTLKYLPKAQVMYFGTGSNSDGDVKDAL